MRSIDSEATLVRIEGVGLLDVSVMDADGSRAVDSAVIHFR